MREDCDKKVIQGYGAAMEGGNNLAKAQMVGMGECAARQSGKGVLRDRIHRLRREADQLEALCKALPEELPHAADSALWDLAIGKR